LHIPVVAVIVSDNLVNSLVVHTDVLVTCDYNTLVCLLP